ncbi:DUF3426 domain-containing protein [Thermodesulforhabdus norvegica]|uniref:MJ0042 family finger-like domain-containing protein n=1 Tax=Thermodesulforhabdus norvegica TaxID=39841 RepID=A0A1I4T8V8_9BACT|nr:DUF3426 domain-containing protein [Thermodesulforhabdus norvegica]SFM73164.1 MJ0042 family finger-like domain-containing protein [Thermodesulforhabdus norvegica]
MVITCESCGTRFKVDEKRLKKPVSKVRCSRCKHVFSVKVETEPEEEMVVLEAPEPEEPRDKEDVTGEEETTDEAEPARKPRTLASTGRQRTAGMARRPPVARSKIFVLTALPLFMIAIATVYYFMIKPEKTEKNAPAGKTPPVEIAQKTEAFFIENLNVGQMLVIQGEIRNVSPYPVSFVTLEAKLIGIDGKVVMSQKFFPGNVLSRDELTQLSLKEIQDRLSRREGDNLSNVHIKPGQTVPFMAVFYSLPPIEELTDYSISYVNAEIEKG